MDRNGVVLARNPRRTDITGLKLDSSPVAEKLRSAKNGVFYDSGADGTPQLFAYDGVVDDALTHGLAQQRPVSAVHVQVVVGGQLAEDNLKTARRTDHEPPGVHLVF